MQAIPAIDLRGGKVVRLAQGRADRQTIYPADPVETARRWASLGAEMVHVVDLDGAFAGEPRNLDIVRAITAGAGIAVELGGGLRDERAIAQAFDAGVARAVIGTRALDGDFLEKIARSSWGARIAVGIDASEGIVMAKGWVAGTGVRAVDLARRVADAGIGTINYTDIARDGMLGGPNIDSLREILASSDIAVIAAGGVSTMADVRRLKALEPEGLAGLIIGKALYEGTIDLAEAVKVCSRSG